MAAVDVRRCEAGHRHLTERVGGDPLGLAGSVPAGRRRPRGVIQLEFLAELPAGPATIRRRIDSVDAAHQVAGYRPPSAAPAFDILLRPAVPPRFDPALVASALRSIPVGGWPSEIVGRRDAALVAVVCSAGLTRRQVQALRSGVAGPDHTVVISQMATTEDPGGCPACALARWLRVHATIAAAGWRAVRNELADVGETDAGSETVHDCTRPVIWPGPTTTVLTITVLTITVRHCSPPSTATAPPNRPGPSPPGRSPRSRPPGSPPPS